MLITAFADFINELAYEKIGDSVIYEENGTYLIIEDYIEDATDIVNKAKLKG